MHPTIRRGARLMSATGERNAERKFIEFEKVSRRLAVLQKTATEDQEITLAFFAWDPYKEARNGMV